MKQVTTIIISLIIGFYTSATSQTKTFNLSDFSNKEWYAEFSTDTYPIPPKQGWRFSENGEVTSFIYSENGRHEGIVKPHRVNTLSLSIKQTISIISKLFLSRQHECVLEICTTTQF